MCAREREREGEIEKESERESMYVIMYVLMYVLKCRSRSREREYVCIKMPCQLLHHLFMLCTVVSVFVFAY